MRWEDERYVRVYTRDTPDWLAMQWQGRATFYELARKVDRSGFIPTGKSGNRGLAGCLHMPPDVVEVGVAELLTDGCVVAVDGGLLIRNFIEAQESRQSDAQRKRSQRERDRNAKRDGQHVIETDKPSHEDENRDFRSRFVTESHDGSQAVTNGHSVLCCAVPTRAVPTHTEDPPYPPQAGGATTGPVQQSLLPNEPTKKRRKAAAKTEHPMPADWKPTPEHAELAKREGVNLEREAERLRFWAEGKLSTSWNGRFATWLLNAGEDRKARGEPPYVPPAPPRPLPPPPPPVPVRDIEAQRRKQEAFSAKVLAEFQAREAAKAAADPPEAT